MGAVWQLLRRARDLRLVLVAGVVSQVGNWMLNVGLVYHVYALTGSTGASAAFVAAAIVPRVMLGPVAGVFVDRWSRRRTMVVTNVVMAVALVPLLAVRSAGQVWILLLVMLVENAVAAFFAPAEQALLPLVVTEDSQVTANALYGQNQNIARLVGSALGGLAVAAGGIAAVTLSDAISFLAAAALIAWVRVARDGARPAVGGGIVRGLAGVYADLAQGVAYARGHRVVRALAVFLLVTGAGEGIMSTLFAPFVRSILHGSPQDYGVVVAAQALGGIAGGLVAAAMGRRAPAATLFAAGALGVGAIDLAIFLYPLAYVAVWPAVVGMVVVGLPAAFCLAGFMTLFQRATADASRGRVYGALSAASGLSALAGTVGAGWLGGRVGIVPVIVCQGAGYALAGLAMRLALRGDAGQIASDERPVAARG